MDQESTTSNSATFSDDMSTAEVSAWLKKQGIPEQYCKVFEGTFFTQLLVASPSLSFPSMCIVDCVFVFVFFSLEVGLHF